MGEHVAWNIVSFLIGGIGVATIFRRGLKTEAACDECKGRGDDKRKEQDRHISDLKQDVRELHSKTNDIKENVIKIATKLGVDD